MAEAILKLCIHCNTSKPLEQMSKAPTSKDGYRSMCKDCFNAYYRKRREEKHEQVRAYELKFHRERRLRVTFGITESDYAAMLAAQSGACAICKAKQRGGRRLAVDHCHTTGMVRALLCDLCNKGIGMFRDSPDLLRRAMEYCQGHTQQGLGMDHVMPSYREPPLGRSGVRGVRVEGAAFVAYIKDGLAERRVGRFKTKEEAVEARRKQLQAGRL